MVEDVCRASDLIGGLYRFSREVLQREQKRKELLVTHVHWRVEALIVFCIVSVNAFFFVFFPQYVIFWIICSLLVIGFSPLVQLLQALVKTVVKKRVPDEEKYVKTLQAFKMLRKSEQFYHIEWSVFFINMRSAAIALGLLCSSNIFAAVGYLLIVRHDAEIGFFIAIQFFLFFLLFTAVILLKPYNRSFETGIGKIVALLKRQNPAAFALQRLTALVLAAFVLYLLLRVLFGAAGGYDAWAGLFVPLPMKIITLVALLALLYHAWIGVRDIWMDYVKPTWIRLALQTLTVLWLLFCAVWSVQILWRV